ncbi:MAG: hypothetical protein M3M98_05415 [Nitrospirota bacterium]|nr:hypothetical protein [Nitrospirota bacterium]
MIRRSLPVLPMVIIFLAATGCHSIHSSAVRDLIQLEGTKIDAAQTNIDLFQKETEARIKFLEQARRSLHESFKALQVQEAKHRFVLASFRNVTNKKGDSAYAAAYLMSLIYMADAQGLEKAVWDQFEEDFCGLRDTANALNDSWKQTATLHAQMQRFAKQSALASVDPEFVASILDQAPGRSEQIMGILNHSRTVNDALEEIVGARILRVDGLARAQTFTADLVELLDRLKKDDGQ